MQLTIKASIIDISGLGDRGTEFKEFTEYEEGYWSAFAPPPPRGFPYGYNHSSDRVRSLLGLPYVGQNLNQSKL